MKEMQEEFGAREFGVKQRSKIINPSRERNQELLTMKEMQEEFGATGFGVKERK